MDCLFCKIVKKEIPATILYSDENVLAFKDLYPQAKNHWLFIHKNHSCDITQMSESAPEQIAQIFKAITRFCKEQGLDQSGFRVVTNNGGDAGQTIFHTHFHVLSGQKLGKFGE